MVSDILGIQVIAIRQFLSFKLLLEDLGKRLGNLDLARIPKEDTPCDAQYKSIDLGRVLQFAHEYVRT